VRVNLAVPLKKPENNGFPACATTSLALYSSRALRENQVKCSGSKFGENHICTFAAEIFARVIVYPFGNLVDFYKP